MPAFSLTRPASIRCTDWLGRIFEAERNMKIDIDNQDRICESERMKTATKSIEQMTESLTIAATSRISPRDFAKFAARCARLSAPLGVVVALHAEAADGNSPDVEKWVEHTRSEWVDVDGMTKEQAREWWMAQYAR